MISVVIPTLNEEHYLGKLLDSLAKQSFKDFEVMVVDGKSEDKTQKVASSFANRFKSFTLLVARKRNVAHQRNLGAEKSSGESLLFLDADAVLPRDFIARLFKKAEGYDCVVCLSKPWQPSTTQKLFYVFVDFTLLASQYFWPIAPGTNIFVKKKVFKKLSGFDERIDVGEDIDFIQRAKRSGFKYRVFTHPFILVSTRRLEYEGTLRYFLKLVHGLFHLIVKGPIRDRRAIGYELGMYDKLEGKDNSKT